MKSSYTFVIVLVVVVAIGLGGWLVWRSRSSSDLAGISDSTEKLSDTQVQSLVARIGQFMVVPSDEKPSVAVIRNAQSLAQQQAFYQGSKDGDVILIYSSRAIIYDPKADKLVNVGPISRTTETTASASASTTPVASATPEVKPEKSTIDVRNGTAKAGLAGTTASDLKKNTWVTSATASDAKGSYTTTVLVDRTAGKKPGALAALESLFGVKAVTDIPKGELASTADFVVILGK